MLGTCEILNTSVNDCFDNKIMLTWFVDKILLNSIDTCLVKFDIM